MGGIYSIPTYGPPVGGFGGCMPMGMTLIVRVIPIGAYARLLFVPPTRATYTYFVPVCSRGNIGDTS